MLRINLLYYKNILDITFVRFVNDNKDSFIRDGDKYVLGKEYTKTALKTIFTRYISEELRKYIKPFNISSLEYYFIIGACEPKNNILLKYKDNGYFPKKLINIINDNTRGKYRLKEKDIVVDIERLNSVFCEIFNDFFVNRKSIDKYIGKNYTSLFFIQHRKLDCYSMFKIIKMLYGKSNCLNIHKEMMQDISHPIIAINEVICQYINSKKELLRSDEFSDIKMEIKSYIDECIQKSLDL